MKLKLKKKTGETTPPQEPVIEGFSLENLAPKEVSGEVPQTESTKGAQLKREGEKPPRNTILKTPGKPRMINTNVMIWHEVMATKDQDEAMKAKKELLSAVMSNFLVLDHETGELVLMTTETFWHNAIALLEKAGYKVFKHEA